MASNMSEERESVLFYGRTKAGRYLTVVVEKGVNRREYYLVTARESTSSEKVLI